MIDARRFERAAEPSRIAGFVSGIDDLPVDLIGQRDIGFGLKLQVAVLGERRTIASELNGAESAAYGCGLDDPDGATFDEWPGGTAPVSRARAAIASSRSLAMPMSRENSTS